MKTEATKVTRVNGVIIGMVTGIRTDGKPLVAYSGNQSDLPVAANSTIALTSDAIGREVALLFEDGEISKPIIMGLIHNESLAPEVIPDSTDRGISVGRWSPDTENQNLTLDGERVELTAENEIVLKCGKSSITLTRAGKVIIRGAYISTRSSGANRIKGGSVQIN